LKIAVRHHSEDEKIHLSGALRVINGSRSKVTCRVFFAKIMDLMDLEF
jgi:hypothetical protein